MTTREPSAVEVIAEALSGHTRSTDPEYVCDCGYQPSDDDPRQDWYAHVCHQTAAALAALKAAGFVVATRDEIRAWSPSEQAELIGGEVEWASGERGYGDCAEQWPDREDAEMDASSIRHHGLDGVLFERIAAGPWREVQP